MKIGYTCAGCGVSLRDNLICQTPSCRFCYNSTAPTTGVKFDQDKLRTDLLPFGALEEVAKVLGHGAKKYGDRNWEKGIAYSRLIGAMLRHLFAYAKGERKDPETGLSHMAHVACSALFIVHFESLRPDLDDLPKNTKDGNAVTNPLKVP